MTFYKEKKYEKQTPCHHGDLLIEDLRANKIVLPGIGTFTPPAEIRDAVLNHPGAFRAGSVGPDFYPDMVLGQASIHPEHSGEWLALMLNRLPYSPQAEREKHLSFALGFMLHYAGDMFGHEYVNAYANGWFPPFTEIATSAEKAKIVARHMLVESYMDQKVPSSASMQLSPPIDFIRDVFTCTEAQQLMKRFKIDNTPLNPLGMFIVLRKDVHDTLADTAIGMIPLVTDYVQHWADDVDTGIKTWLETWGRAADAFTSTMEGKISYVQGILENWFLLKLTSMIGIPDFVGQVISFINELDLLKPIKDLIKNMFKDFVIAIAKAILGGTYKTLEEAVKALEQVFKDPKTYLDNGIVFSEKNISQKLDRDFGNYGRENDTTKQTFHAVLQCLNMSKLCLVGADNLNVITGSSLYKKTSFLPGARIGKITVHTANKLYAGTDNNVYIGIRYNGAVYDTLCDKPGYNDFERDDTDTYSFFVPEYVNLDRIDAIIARMSGSTLGGDWDCDWIQIKDDGGNVLLQADDDFCLSTGNKKIITNFKRKYSIPSKTLNLDHMIMSFLWSLDGKGDDNSNPAKKKQWELGFNIYSDPSLRTKVFRPLFETPYVPSGKSLTGIEVCTGEIVDSITFNYSDGSKNKYGGPGGKAQAEFTLNGERIVAASYTPCGYGYYYGNICRLDFKTDKGRSHTFKSSFYDATIRKP